MMEIKTPIIDGLNRYLNSEHIPWHMPGHKRRPEVGGGEVTDLQGVAADVRRLVMGVEGMDVTEVPGLDDLHCPKEMIKESQEQLSRLYGTYKSYYLVNGATCGIMAAITACGRSGIIVADNCHKSVINTVQLLGLPVAYAKTTGIKELDCQDACMLPDIRGAVIPEELERLCREHTEYSAVIITSPTYEGVVSDIRAIRKISRKYGKLLIVDEAHGAHLPFMKPDISAIRLGADVVIQSLHKTMESLTQTAILHIVNKCSEAESIKRYLSVFMSSSPSYILLSSMELAVTKAAEKAQKGYFTEYQKNLDMFLDGCKAFENVRVLDERTVNKLKAYGYDKSRIVIYDKRLVYGKRLEELLYEEGHIVSEMSGLNYVVLISTYVDTQEDFDKLYKVLCRVDERLSREDTDSEVGGETLDALVVGAVALNNIYVYPPGIPIIKKDEIITQEAVNELTMLVNSGKELRNM